jgi:23S rRNA (guanosine2251-2'-O)-methyltransferase
MKKLTNEEIVARQKLKRAEPRIPLVVVLDDIRSLHNVGAIFRTADGVGVSKIWLCGITGCPPHAQIRKTALGAEEAVPWEYAPDAIMVLERYKRAGHQIVLLEQATESREYDRFDPKGPVCLVVGNEITGINEQLLELCDEIIEIPMAGGKNSLNAAVAFGVVAYHLRSRFFSRSLVSADSASPSASSSVGSG